MGEKFQTTSPLQYANYASDSLTENPMHAYSWGGSTKVIQRIVKFCFFANFFSFTLTYGTIWE